MSLVFLLHGRLLHLLPTFRKQAQAANTNERLPLALVCCYEHLFSSRYFNIPKGTESNTPRVIDFRIIFINVILSMFILASSMNG
ncbi:MAG: hypothetical protein JJT77_08910 [Crocinitomicaceae bacterium]|nr:hypothetical protein [Crocinitomicaceae bacterium]